jgi:hypothetical protein
MAGILGPDLDQVLAARRAEELRRAADRSRLAALARRPRHPIRLRLGPVTVEIAWKSSPTAAPP